MIKGFKPMLSGKAGDTFQFPVLASPKLDGIRCVVSDGVAWSRNLKPIPNRHIQKILSANAFNGLDGELIVGDPRAPDCYRRTTSAVMSEDGEPEFTYYVFDNIIVDAKTPFETRLASISIGIPSPVVAVQHVDICDRNELDAYEAEQLAAGLEGVMVRDPRGPYKYGRSSTREGFLLKVKRFADGEAEVIDTYELMHNDNTAFKGELGQTKRTQHQENMVPMGTLGGLVVKDCESGIKFRIGTGYDAALRADLWQQRKTLIGAVVKYKYFEGGVKIAPRFPVFLGFRDRVDF